MLINFLAGWWLVRDVAGGIFTHEFLSKVVLNSALRFVVLVAEKFVTILVGDTNLNIVFALLLGSHVVDNVILSHEDVSKVPGRGLLSLGLENSKVASILFIS